MRAEGEQGMQQVKQVEQEGPAGCTMGHGPWLLPIWSRGRPHRAYVLAVWVSMCPSQLPRHAHNASSSWPQVVFVSLFSVANAIGRLLFGNMSEHYLHTRGTPRTLFMVVVGALVLCSPVPNSSLCPPKRVHCS